MSMWGMSIVDVVEVHDDVNVDVHVDVDAEADADAIG